MLRHWTFPRTIPLFQRPSFRTQPLLPGVECIVIALFRHSYPSVYRPLPLVTPRRAKVEIKGKQRRNFWNSGGRNSWASWNAIWRLVGDHSEGSNSRSNTRFYGSGFVSSAPTETNYRHFAKFISFTMCATLLSYVISETLCISDTYKSSVIIASTFL